MIIIIVVVVAVVLLIIIIVPVCVTHSKETTEIIDSATKAAKPGLTGGLGGVLFGGKKLIEFTK